MKKKFSARRHSDRNLSAGPPIDWAGVIGGTVKPAIDVNFALDKETTQTIYVATGVLSAAILIGALIK